MSYRKTSLWLELIACGIALHLATVAAAAPVRILNAGFEDLPLDDDTFSLSASGWVVADAASSINPGPGDSPGGIAPEGDNVAFAAGGSLQQAVGANLAGATEYVLCVDVIERFNISIFDYGIQLLAGSTVIAEDAASLDPGSGNFLVSTITYMSTASDPLIGQPLSIILSSTGQQVNFDEVVLNANPIAPVPTLSWAVIVLLVLLGAVGCVMSGRCLLPPAMI
jgi:hypothetical protein